MALLERSRRRSSVTPFSGLLDLQDEMNRLFNSLF